MTIVIGIGPQFETRIRSREPGTVKLGSFSAKFKCKAGGGTGEADGPARRDPLLQSYNGLKRRARK
jgi:hypothetical protein